MPLVPLLADERLELAETVGEGPPERCSSGSRSPFQGGRCGVRLQARTGLSGLLQPTDDLVDPMGAASPHEAACRQGRGPPPWPPPTRCGAPFLPQRPGDRPADRFGDRWREGVPYLTVCAGFSALEDPPSSGFQPWMRATISTVSFGPGFLGRLPVVVRRLRRNTKSIDAEFRPSRLSTCRPQVRATVLLRPTDDSGRDLVGALGPTLGALPATWPPSGRKGFHPPSDACLPTAPARRSTSAYSRGAPQVRSAGATAAPRSPQRGRVPTARCSQRLQSVKTFCRYAAKRLALSPRTFSRRRALGFALSARCTAQAKRSRSSIAPSCFPAMVKGGMALPPR